MTNINFYHLSANPKETKSTLSTSEQDRILSLWQKLYRNNQSNQYILQLKNNICKAQWLNFQHRWQNINKHDDLQLTDWLIDLFNQLFNQPTIKIPTILVRGQHEPEYFPSDGSRPARIEFAHGFFSSALHEISHWCIAGSHRKLLRDFGYWYEADGRSEKQQFAFEQVEIKPQAIECLFNMACNRYFYVSQDNLNANFDTSNSTFASDVYQKSLNFLNHPERLPPDALSLIWIFLSLCQPNYYK